MNARDESYVKMKNYQFKDVLGWGQSDVVYLIYDPAFQRDFALKVMLQTKFNKNEIDVMKDVDHPYIIRLYNYEYYEDAVYLLMEFCPQSLEKAIKRRNISDSKTTLKYCMGVVNAIKACHRYNVAHLDIKPANFLIDQYDRIRVCDFGLSSINKAIGDCCHVNRQFAGSVPFMAPEILEMKPYDPFKADIWAVGVTLYFIATGKFPWDGLTKEEMCENLMKNDPNLDLIDNKDLAAAIGDCLEKDPSKRPTIFDLGHYPVFKEAASCTHCTVRKNTFLPLRKYLSPSTLIIKPKMNRGKLQISI